jgi:acetyl esterase/lipase
MPARLSIALLAVLVLLGGCAKAPKIAVTPIRHQTLDAMRRHLLAQPPDLDLFRLRGPFKVTARKNHALQLSSGESVAFDLYVASPAERAPLVILAHGYDNTKEDHAYQGMHLASWGMHSLALDLPKQGPWIENGETLARVVTLVRQRPELLDLRIDPERIIVAGHSFGGSAVAIALAAGAPAAGAVLLDPAGVSQLLPGYLKRVRRPVMVIGADWRIGTTIDRDHFFAYIPAGIGEVSISDAQHEDAQFTMDAAENRRESGESTAERSQLTFASALTASAFSLGFTGTLDYAWTSFSAAVRSGVLFDAKRK